MKTLSVLLVLIFLAPSLSFAKRKKTSRFQRRHAVVLNTQKLFDYNESSVTGAFNLAYAYNRGNFEFQPYLAFDVTKPRSADLKIANLLLGLSLHFNIIENRRGKRWVPYILVGSAYFRPREEVNIFKVEAGGGFKYFLTSRLAINPEVLYSYHSEEKTTKANIHFRYYF